MLKLLNISISCSVESGATYLWCYSSDLLFLVMQYLQTFIVLKNNLFFCVELITRIMFLMHKCVTYLKN